MKIVNIEKDFEYFKNIWEHKNTLNNHTSKNWDKRADEWKEELTHNNEFRESLTDRVKASCKFLHSKGLLKSNDSIIDIGCGTGRFVAEFAKTSKFAMGLDISNNMLDLAKSYANENNLTNTNFICCDFKSLDIKKLNLEKKFDLVFTSITPAINTYKSLHRMEEICKGYCFNSSFINWQDSIEDEIAQNIFNLDEYPYKKNHMHWYYSLFNLLLLMGYLPVTEYFKQNRTEKIKLDNLSIHYYTKSYTKENNNLDIEDLKTKIYNYLSKKTDSNGYFTRSTQRWYGWLLWDINTKKILFS